MFKKKAQLVEVNFWSLKYENAGKKGKIMFFENKKSPTYFIIKCTIWDRNKIKYFFKKNYSVNIESVNTF